MNKTLIITKIPSVITKAFTTFILLCDAGDVYRTRQLTPFLDCVDNSPVVRSVLPKLLLQYR